MNLSVVKKEPKKENEGKFTGVTTEGPSCRMCSGTHFFWKCKKYKNLTGIKRWEFVKELNICFNCFQDGHKSPSYPSSNTCFRSDCGKKHHTSLHDYYTERGESRKASKRNKQKPDPKKDSGKEKADTNVETVAAVKEDEMAHFE